MNVDNLRKAIEHILNKREGQRVRVRLIKKK